MGEDWLGSRAGMVCAAKSFRRLQLGILAFGLLLFAPGLVLSDGQFPLGRYRGVSRGRAQQSKNSIDGGQIKSRRPPPDCSAHNHARKMQNSTPRRHYYYFGVAYRFAGGIISRGSMINSGAARARGRLAASSAILWRHLVNWVIPLLPRPSSGSTSMCGQSLIEGPRCRSPYFGASPLNAVFHNASLQAFRPASTV